MRNLELPGRSPVHSTEGMACTSQPLATQTAIDVLKSGGNALDAAVRDRPYLTPETANNAGGQCEVETKRVTYGKYTLTDLQVGGRAELNWLQ